MIRDNETIKEIVTVSGMAQMLGLSRSRLYQLIHAGTFPAPKRNPNTNRPYFDQVLQSQCLTIRRSNRGADGIPHLFYARSFKPAKPKPKRSSPETQKQPSNEKHDPLLEELHHGLKELGMKDVSATDTRPSFLTAASGF